MKQFWLQRLLCYQNGWKGTQSGAETGGATLVKTVTQLVWYPPYSSGCGAQVLIFRAEKWQLRLLLSKLEMFVTMKFSGAHEISATNFVSQELPASATLTCCGWVNKYCFIHSLVSCPVNLSRSLFLHDGVTDEEEEETSFCCCLCNLSPTFQVSEDSCP